MAYFLTHFMPLVYFYTAWKQQKTSNFLFQGVQKETGGMKWVQEIRYNI